MPFLELTLQEVSLLRIMISERINEAKEEGLQADHPSSVFRRGIFDKLQTAMDEEGVELDG